MIDIVRRYEYMLLRKTSRKNMGKFVQTVTQSCQLHDSNLINVELSRHLKELDLSKIYFGEPQLDIQALSKGNKSTECWSINTARFIAGHLKKSKDWKSFLLSEYGDACGIKSVKSARFWSVMIIMGTYLFPRLKYLREFAQTRKADLERGQFGGNLDDFERNQKLFEFDCLLERVDYDGFHSQFNHGASNRTSEDQAKYVYRVVNFHKKCVAHAPTRARYWRGRAFPAILERQMCEWANDYFAAHGRRPGKRATRRHKIKAKMTLNYEWAAHVSGLQIPLADYLQIPSECQGRVKAMHQAVVTKCDQFLGSVTATGVVNWAVACSSALSTNMPVECVHCRLPVCQLRPARLSGRLPDPLPQGYLPVRAPHAGPLLRHPAGHRRGNAPRAAGRIIGHAWQRWRATSVQPCEPPALVRPTGLPVADHVAEAGSGHHG